MKQAQKITLLLAAMLFSGLYFGFSTKPNVGKKSELMKPGGVVASNFAELISKSKSAVSQQQNEQIEALEKLVRDATSDAEKSALLKKLASFWHQIGQSAASGAVAWQVAEIEKADTAWSVAGATFFESLSGAKDETTHHFLGEKAAEAFGKAAAANPKNVEHLVNQALVWAEVPPDGQPMKAALTLRELAEKNPNHPAPFNALGRLAIKTGQWQKAIERLEHSWELDKNNPKTPCLLAVAYKNAGNLVKSGEFEKICKSISGN